MDYAVPTPASCLKAAPIPDKRYITFSACSAGIAIKVLLGCRCSCLELITSYKAVTDESCRLLDSW
jgi:hypothetical protein